MKGNTILVLILICVFGFLISWIIQIQVGLKTKVNEPKLETQQLKLSINKGKELFKKEECIRCHKPTKKGYHMSGVTERYEQDFLIAFIRNEDSLVRIKNPDVIALKEEYNWANGLHNKKHLTKRQVIDILNYLSLFD